MSYRRAPVEDINLRPLLRLLPVAIVVLLVLAVAWTSYYTVPTNSQAVVLRFGRYLRTDEPGLHFKFPLGIDRALIVPVRLSQRLEFGFRTAEPGRRTVYAPRTAEDEQVSLMLTGDLNIADVEWIVQYRIKDSRAYLFHVADVSDTVRDATESVMRRLVGDRSVDEVITIGREELASEAKVEIEKLLDSYDCGVQVIEVRLQNATPPEPVKEAFDDVNRARQEKDQRINKARAEFNQAIPAARGKAERMILEAQGYRDKKVAIATGEAAALLAQFEEYEKAPGPTKERLYIETLETILAGAERKVIVDGRLQGILPLIDLGLKGGAR